MPKSYFEVCFGFEDIIRILHVIKGSGHYVPRLTICWIIYKESFTDIPSGNDVWWHQMYHISDETNITLCGCNTAIRSDPLSQSSLDGATEFLAPTWRKNTPIQEVTGEDGSWFGGGRL